MQAQFVAYFSHREDKNSMVPIVRQLPKGMLRNTSHVMKVNDILHAQGKPSALNYPCLMFNPVMIMALATVKRLSGLNFLRITPNIMQVTEDSVAFQSALGAKNDHPNHPYGSIIKIRQYSLFIEKWSGSGSL